METRGIYAFSATLISSCILGSSIVHAAEHELNALGESVPLWYEYRAAVNDSGVVAWSQLVGGFPQATKTDASTSVSYSQHADVVAAYPAATRTLAFEINQSGDVVGFRSVTNHDGSRQAQLWTAGSTLIDLHPLFGLCDRSPIAYETNSLN